jgi:hypothetical protein
MKNQSELEAILPRAAVDAQFRAALLRDPHQAIEKVTGVAVPQDLKIQFVEPPRGVDALIVLPPAVEFRTDLTLQELETMVDGFCWFTCERTCDKTCGESTCIITSTTISIPEDV